MLRPLLIAASLLGVAAPAFAEGVVSATPGALAGRSPHQALIVADAPSANCGKVMHSLPAGKPHTYGLNAIAARPCAQPALASAPTPGNAAAEN